MRTLPGQPVSPAGVSVVSSPFTDRRARSPCTFVKSIAILPVEMIPHRNTYG